MSAADGQPTIGDAFGAALLDAHHGNEGWHVVERDDGLVEVASAAGYFAGIDSWSSHEVAALDLVEGRVLDIGAGSGRHSLELLERGLDVLALDVSAGAVEVCRERGVASTFLGTVDALAATDPEPFDAMLLLGNNLGLLSSDVGSWRMLEAMRRLLRPGGVVVGTGRDPYLTDEPEHIAYHQRNLDRRRMGGQTRMRVRRRHLATDWFDYLFTSPEELGDLSERAGWHIDHVTDPDPRYLCVLRPS